MTSAISSERTRWLLFILLAIAGILAGEAAVAANTIGGLSMPALLPQWPHAITDINTGFLALLLNVCTMLIVSRLTPPRTRPRTPRVG